MKKLFAVLAMLFLSQIAFTQETGWVTKGILEQQELQLEQQRQMNQIYRNEQYYQSLGSQNHNLNIVMLAQQKNKEYKTSWHEAVKGDADAAVYGYNLFCMFNGSGNRRGHEQWIQILEKSSIRDKSSRVNIAIARFYEHVHRCRGDRKKALSAFRKALKINRGLTNADESFVKSRIRFLETQKHLPETALCVGCGGNGTGLICDSCYGSGFYNVGYNVVQCSTCSGRGIKPCGSCGGMGRVKAPLPHKMARLQKEPPILYPSVGNYSVPSSYITPPEVFSSPKSKTCTLCNGTGEFGTRSWDYGGGRTYAPKQCPSCSGTGMCY